VAEILLTRDQITAWATKSFALSKGARMALMIGIQAIPDDVFRELAETIADIGDEMQPEDAGRLERKFKDRASRRDLIRAVMDFVRND
jgi:hypothetical protein